MSESKQINFTIVPDDGANLPRVYVNFCAIAHTPFDVTLTFCEVLPLTPADLQDAESEHVVRAPVRVKLAVPPQLVPTLVNALQEHMRLLSDAPPGSDWPKGPVH